MGLGRSGTKKAKKPSALKGKNSMPSMGSTSSINSDVIYAGRINRSPQPDAGGQARVRWDCVVTLHWDTTLSAIDPDQYESVQSMLSLPSLSLDRAFAADGRCGEENPQAEAHRRFRGDQRSPVRRLQSR